MYIYGIPPRTMEEIEKDRIELFNYLRAFIYAESINPEKHYDYDNEKYNELIEIIALSDLSPLQRQELIKLLKAE